MRRLEEPGTVYRPAPYPMSADAYLDWFFGSYDGEWDVELIGGRVYIETATTHRQAVARAELLFDLMERFPTQWVLARGSVRVDDDSLWNPDVYVCTPGIADGSYPAPDDVPLAVEIGSTEANGHIARKVRRYSRAGVPECWQLVLEPDGARMFRHTEPDGDAYRYVTESAWL